METWNGFEKEEFQFEGRRAIIVFPSEKEDGGNWTLKTEYWGAFPETEIELLKRGFHAAYLENRTRFATDDDCDVKARFVHYISETYGLRNKCVPVGMSCGGAHAVNFAGKYPESVACMFLDAPVLNFCDFPAKARWQSIWDREFTIAYPGVEKYNLLKLEQHPLNQIDSLIANKIPIIMLYGDQDQTVIYEENGKLMEEAYLKHKELLTIILRSTQGHHPHGLIGSSDVINYIFKHV